MARNWSGAADSILEFSPGALASLGDGAYTWLAYVQTAHSNCGFMRWRDGVGTYTRFVFTDGGDLFTEGGVAGPAVTEAAWRIVGFSMPDVSGGAETATYLYWNGTTFSSSAGGSTAIDGDTDQPEIGHSIYRTFGDIAVVGVFAGEISAATLNGSSVTTELQAWMDLGAIALWPMNQAVATDSVLDVTGNGADQSGLNGINQTISSDPPGFSYSLTSSAVAPTIMVAPNQAAVRASVW